MGLSGSSGPFGIFRLSFILSSVDPVKRHAKSFTIAVMPSFPGSAMFHEHIVTIVIDCDGG